MDDWQGRTRAPITEERLDRALSVLQDIVREHGPAFAPLLESIRQTRQDFRTRKENTSPPAETPGSAASCRAA